MKPGAYQVDMRAVVQHRAGDLPSWDNLALVLLTRAPAPEGGNVNKVKAPGYTDQAIAIEPPRRGRTAHNRDPIQFVDVLDWSKVSHVGLVNAEGDLLAYGPLKSSPGPAGADEMVFAATAVRIHFK